jgi:pyruvate kinase
VNKRVPILVDLLGTTYIGVSFVANKDDILRIRDIVKDKAANKLKICYGVYLKKVSELKTLDNIIRTAKKRSQKIKYERLYSNTGWCRKRFKRDNKISQN